MRFLNRSNVFHTLLLALGLPAAAQVTLENSVQKVERFVDETGAVQTRLVDADKVIPGDELRYTIVFVNDGSETVDANSIVITNPVPDNTVYIDGTAFGSGTDVTFSIDDGAAFDTAPNLAVVEGDAEVPASASDYTTIRWAFAPVLQPGAKSHVSFNVRLQ